MAVSNFEPATTNVAVAVGGADDWPPRPASPVPPPFNASITGQYSIAELPVADDEETWR